MAKSLLIAGNFDPDATSANTTQYWPIGADNSYAGSAAENDKEVTFRAAGTLSNLRLTVTVESFTADSTWRFRKNNANGNQVVTFQATGILEDTSNSDSISAGDEGNYQNVPPASGTMTFEYCQMTFAPSSNTVTVMSTNSESWATASVTTFIVLNGMAQAANTTEANAICDQRKAGTFQNVGVNISANSRGASTYVLRMRKNGANGNQVISLTNETGIVEDTSNSDSVTTGDDCNYSAVVGAGAGTITLKTFNHFTSTSGVAQYIAGRTAGHVIDGNDANSFIAIASKIGITDQTTETNAQAKVPEACTFSDLTCNVTANTEDVGEDCVFTFRKNAAGAGMSVTYVGGATGETGITTDTSNSVTCAAGDLVCVECNPAGASTDDVTLRAVSVWSTIVSNQNITRSLPTETVTVGESIARLSGKTRALSTETVSVSETRARMTTKNRSLSTETVSISETPARMAAKARTLSTETVSVSENIVRVKGKPRALDTETVTVGENLTRMTTKNRALPETVSIGETATRLKGAMRSLSTETVTVAENVARVVARLVSRALPTETVTVSENLARQKAASRSLPETVSVGEVLARIKTVARSLATETVSISENLARLKASIRTLPETVAVSESLTRMAAKIRTIPVQTVAISENVSRVVVSTKNVVRTLSETVSIGDSLARQAAKQRTITENIAISEVLQGYKNGVELVPPAAPENPLMGPITNVFIRAPKKQLHLHEIREGINEKAYCPITIPAFSDLVPKAYCPIRLIERAPRIGARISLRPQLRLAKSRITVDAQYDNSKKAYAPRIALQPQEEEYQKAKAKIINPQQLNRMAKLMRLFFMAQQLDD